MIRVTNNMEEFIQKCDAPLYVYGAGTNGYYVGFYLNRLSVEWEGYIDRNVSREGIAYNEHFIYSREKLIMESQKEIRVLISSVSYAEILAGLFWLDNKYSLNVLCFVPVYEDHIELREMFNINKCLAFFRRKLFKGETPTIISNDCSAGYIYNVMDMFMLSPTINTGIEPCDFIKLCKNLKFYMEQDMNSESLRYTRTFRFSTSPMDNLTGKIGDISVVFAHLKPDDKPVERWNIMRQRINWESVIYVMKEQNSSGSVPRDTIREFLELKGKKLFINTDSTTLCDGVSAIYMPENYISDRNTPIEVHFDLLGWLNEGVEYGIGR